MTWRQRPQRKAPAAPRDRGLRTQRTAFGSVADVHSPPAETVGRQHAAGDVATFIAATDEADAKAMAMTPVVVVMRVLRPEHAARRSGAGGQRHGAERSGGNEGEGQFAKHRRSP